MAFTRYSPSRLRAATTSSNTRLQQSWCAIFQEVFRNPDQEQRLLGIHTHIRDHPAMYSKLNTITPLLWTLGHGYVKKNHPAVGHNTDKETGCGM
ncbi:hypothetical protein L2E82_01963 [Cichorium intybus]|uniref:Uncharacterized protein n=1 Tax=Cichorium intybus TaxID=13427 RepID=A0ACB9GZZ5_CICIN|nr:hypothetical protein L2E82_01963 [Cichorium intybus]